MKDSSEWFAKNFGSVEMAVFRALKVALMNIERLLSENLLSKTNDMQVMK